MPEPLARLVAPLSPKKPEAHKTLKGQGAILTKLKPRAFLSTRGTVALSQKSSLRSFCEDP